MTQLHPPPEAAAKPLPHLPLPSLVRWQPLRSGVLQLYKFDEQEFWYERGRLLLRGNNGTGKSRVLALQLPFLLDGEIASHRVEPDRDPAKRMEWNLLLGKHKNRRGYSWIEFGRLDAGVCCYLTIGCGLQAVAQQGITAKWFFVTSRRIGQDLRLDNESATPLTKEQLTVHLGENGKLFTTAQDYRREVDGALFGLGAQRYEALLELLITLRQPQLSRSLDEALLSKALSDALPPLSQRIIDDVAESMRGLEQDQEQLESHRASAVAIKTFMATYARYACAASRRKAEVVRQTHAKFEGIGRELRAAESGLEGGRAEAQAIDKELETLGLTEAEADAAHNTLLSSPQMAAARELEDAKREATERQNDEAAARRDEEVAAANRDRVQIASAAAAQRVTDLGQASKRLLARAHASAESIGMSRVHDQELSKAEVVEPRHDRAIVSAKAAIGKATESRRSEARRLGASCVSADRAIETLNRSKLDSVQAATNADAARAAVEAANTRVREDVSDVIAEYERWRGAAVELRPEAADDLQLLLEEWAQSGAGESPLGRVTRAAEAEATRRLAGIEADLETQVESVRAEIVEVEDDRAEAISGQHEAPPPPHTRPVDGRRGLPGAPFWALCDFRDEISDKDRAGFEAALEASGLLDAWVRPSGEVVDNRTQDVFLTADPAAESSDNDRLSSVLTPSPAPVGGQAAVPAAIVWSILRAISSTAQASGVYVAADGSWQNGPLSGRWAKPIAQHIGAAARERARLARLAELEQRVSELRERAQELEEERLQLQQRRQVAETEAAGAPRDDRIRDSLAAHGQARRFQDDADSKLRAAEQTLVRAHEAADIAVAERDQVARDLDLTNWIGRATDLDDAIRQYSDACGECWTMLFRLADALLQADAELARFRDADSTLDERRNRTRQSVERAKAANTRHLVLEQTKGAEIREVSARLHAAKESLRLAKAATKGANDRKANITGRVSGLAQQVSDLSVQRQEQEGIRNEGVESYRRFVGSGVLGIAIPQKRSLQVGDWSITRLVDLARECDQELTAVSTDDSVWSRQQNQLFEQFKTLEDSLLQHDHRPDMRTEADVLVVRAVFQGRHCTIDDLQTALEEEVTQRQSLLDAREREILENHLIGEVARHLHDQLHFAANLVKQMNQELERIPTSSGMMLRFRWEPKDDGPAGLVETRSRLLGAVGTWSAQERADVGRFLQERIRAERDSNGTASWQEQLAAALDYRAWHDFVIDRNTDGEWRRLTRRTHGTGSGGEKAVALMIPMLAAAASHYRSASKTAPRLILLDEAFAGVDTEMRAKCMGFLETFDLDFIMTSEREWCCYSTLPGVAICQLSARPRIDAVHVSRWVWTGTSRVEANWQRNGHPHSHAEVPPRTSPDSVGESG